MDNNSVLPTDYTYEQYISNESQYEKHTYDSPEIRLCIFLITNVCVGLPALLWASNHLHLHRKIRGQISSFIVLLLLSDLIELVLSLYVVKQLLRKYIYWNNYMVLVFWSVLSFYGFHLHQLVALEGVLRLKSSVFCSYFLTLLFHHNPCAFLFHTECIDCFCESIWRFISCCCFFSSVLAQVWFL